MKVSFAVALLSGLVLVSAQYPLTAFAARGNGKISLAQTSSTAPVILYAQWIGKTLDVEGANFGVGSTIIVDGQALKTSNVDTALTFALLAKKAKKKVARNQAITLQVQNPDGQTSDPFPFYSGFLVTLNDHGSTLHLSVGDRFLLFLPPRGEPPTLGWVISVMVGSDPTALVRHTDELPIPSAQGFFEATHSGQVFLHLDAIPLCPPLPPEACGPSGVNLGQFDLAVFIDK